MRLSHTSLATALFLLFASVVYPQTPTTNAGDTPVFRVQVWGYIAEDFTARVLTYYELRRNLQKGLPVLRVTDYPAEIRNTQLALAERIRVARKGARSGEIFTPSIRVEFRKALSVEVDANTLGAIMDDNPGRFSHHINSIYRQGEPFATMPPNILAVLPRLPDDLQYRFLGRDLILLDTAANVILDRIPCAIQCTDR
jgi:hypothetical protein